MGYLKLKTATILLAAVASTICLWVLQTANAQITNNNTSTNQNISGSFPSTLNQTIISQIKIGMGNVTAMAEKTIGPNSHAVLAILEIERGSLVYTILVTDSGFNFHRVQINPVNGKVLSSQPLTIAMKQQALLEMLRGIMVPPQAGTMGPRQGGIMAPGPAGIMGPRHGALMAPGQAAPGQAAPGQAAPGQAAPGQAAPGQAAPGQAAPGQAAPGQAGIMGPSVRP
jgi:hypothetical protein